MKPALAIVAAAVDIDASVARVLTALAGERDAVTAADKHARLGAAARETAKVRRLDTGHELLGIRGTWPPSGPKAKGWSEYLKRVGLDDSTAVRYMDLARRSLVHGGAPGETPDRDSAHERVREPNPQDDDHGQYGPRLDPLPDPDRAIAAPFRQPTESEAIRLLAGFDADARKRIIGGSKANVAGGSGEPDRGTWCTPKALALAVGAWDVDPFSNPRSHIVAAARCMLEDGGDGFGDHEGVGRYRVGTAAVQEADATTRVWIQPPYERDFVSDVVDHYKHTRFCALLRWSPDVEWFARLWPHVAAVAFQIGERTEFEPPPGVASSGGAPFPHALFYADERDVTDEVRAMCLVWRVEHPTNEPAAAPMSDAAATTH